MPITKASGQAVAPAAKGDLVVGSATNDAAVLAVGSTNQVLTVDSSTTTGLKWGDVSAGAYTQLASGNLPTNASTVTISSISGSYRDLVLYVRDINSGASLTTRLIFRLNNDSNSVYYNLTGWQTGNSTTGAGNAILRTLNIPPSTADAVVKLDIFNYADSTVDKIFSRIDMLSTVGFCANFGGYDSATAITSVSIIDADGVNFGAGNYILYGVK